VQSPACRGEWPFGRLRAFSHFAQKMVSLYLSFSVFGMLIIVNRHQADPNGLSGDNFVATAGGIGTILVAWLSLSPLVHWRFCARRSAAPSERRQSARLTFSRPRVSHASRCAVLTSSPRPLRDFCGLVLRIRSISPGIDGTPQTA
jgi:hypothetical protein